MLGYNYTSQNARKLYVGDHLLDPQLHAIRTENGYVRLRSKLWYVLSYLIDNENRLVTRESLVSIIWAGNQLTGEQGITHSICHLRRILKKNEIDAQIITIPKRGYVLRQAAKNKNTEQENDTLVTAIEQAQKTGFTTNLSSSSTIDNTVRFE